MYDNMDAPETGSCLFFAALRHEWASAQTSFCRVWRVRLFAHSFVLKRVLAPGCTQGGDRAGLTIGRQSVPCRVGPVHQYGACGHALFQRFRLSDLTLSVDDPLVRELLE